MELFFIILLLCLLVVAIVKKNSNKTEVLLDCSTEECQWNNNQSCPYKVIRYQHGNNRFRRKVKGLNECCKTRQTRVKMAKMILDNRIKTKNSKMIKSAKKEFEKHKQQHPEEHKFLFGE